MRLYFILLLFTFYLFSSNAKMTALGGSGSIDLSRVSSINHFEANMARDRQEPQLYFSISIKSSHKNILSQTDKIKIYNVQRADIDVNVAGNKVSDLGLTSIQNALNAIEDLNKNENNNMIEYIFPDITLAYRFRNIGVGFNTKSYGYAYINSVLDMKYNKNKTHTTKTIKYKYLRDIFDDYMQNSLLLTNRYITINKFFMSYSNMIPIMGSKVLYGMSINTISANYSSESNNTIDRFDSDKIYSDVRAGKQGESSDIRFSYNLSFIFVPPLEDKLSFGIGFINLNPNTFGNFYHDRQIIFSGNYLMGDSLKFHYERDLVEYKNIYQTQTNKKQSFGLEYEFENSSLMVGYEQNTNIFQDGTISVGFSYENLDIGYRTKNHYSGYSTGSIKEFGEFSISFKKDT